MPMTKLLTSNKQEFVHDGSSGVTLTLVVGDQLDAEGNLEAHFEAEWEIENTAELTTIGANFLLWMDDVFKGTGVVENTIERFLRESGRLENGVGRIRYTAVPGHAELPERREIISEYRKQKEKDERN